MKEDNTLSPQTHLVGWIYEDELPKNYPYDAMFPHSKVDVVRMFPVFAPQSQMTVSVPKGYVLAPIKPTKEMAEGSEE